MLSYGLLAELNKDVHPVFINESGRHWFTALNAHNHLKDSNPNTAKYGVTVIGFLLGSYEICPLSGKIFSIYAPISIRSGYGQWPYFYSEHYQLL